jgi:hypothetical protein
VAEVVLPTMVLRALASDALGVPYSVMPLGSHYGTSREGTSMGRIPIALACSALIILLLTNCGGRRPPATIQPSPDVVPPAPISGGAFPQSIEGVLSAAIGYRLYTTEELADPGIRSIIKECERNRDAECQSVGMPVDQRRSFTRGVDQKIFAYFELRGLSFGAVYDLRCVFLDPTESSVTVLRAVYTIPPERPNLSHYCWMPLQPTTLTGKWAVQLYVNGEPALVLRFEVA